MNFFGLGLAELVLILVVLLILFGSKRLPDLARSIGQSVKELKNSFAEPNENVSERKKREGKQQGS